MIDSHCHLEREYYGDDVDAVIDPAVHAGVTTMVAVGASNVCDGAVEAIALAERHDNIFATAGIHPHEATHVNEETLARIEGFLDHPKVVALGEVGLDFFYDNSPRQEQRTAFGAFLKMAKRHNMPIMLHVRDAHEETFELIDDVGLPEAGGVVHCFSAGPKEAEGYLARGMYLSIPGIVTFKKAEALREAVGLTPLDKMLIETDAPYLAPIPYRGKPNEPAYLVETAKRVAEVKGITPEELAEKTSENTRKIFRLPKS